MRLATHLNCSLLLSLPLFLACAPAAGAAAEPYRVLPLELRVPAAPVPVRGGGKTLLVYELHITNLDPKGRELPLTSLDVLADGREAPLLHLAGAELSGALRFFGAPEDAQKARTLGSGRRAVAFLWVAIDGPAPAALRHRVTVHGETGEKSLEGGRTPVRAGSPPALSPPLRGDRWVAVNGPANGTGHRRAMQVIDGLPWIAQRFAIDWIRLGADGLPFHGDPKKNESWVGYGSELLAVADGTVSDTKDGIPENVPLAPERAVPMTLDTIDGNYVVLDLGDGRFALYAHLQPGSLRVKVGDRVRKGQVLGLLGNSGNSDAPHLHFHVMDASAPMVAEGLPYVFPDLTIQGRAGSADDLLAGKPWKPAPAEEHRTGEIPLENEVVRFP